MKPKASRPITTEKIARRTLIIEVWLRVSVSPQATFLTLPSVNHFRPKLVAEGFVDEFPLMVTDFTLAIAVKRDDPYLAGEFKGSLFHDFYVRRARRGRA